MAGITDIKHLEAPVSASNPFPVTSVVTEIAAGDNNIGNVDVASLPTAQIGGATTANSLTVTNSSDRFVTKTFTPSIITGAQTAEDIIFATEEITTVGLANGATVALRQIIVSDIDDEGAALRLFFFNANTSLGTEGSTPDIDDTEILTFIGSYPIASGDWFDTGANRVATVMLNPPLVLKLGAATTSLWVAGNSPGTPNYTGASDLQFQFVFERL